MDDIIKVGITGYGNLGKGVEKALKQNSDFELVSIFTRREPQSIKSATKVEHVSQISDYQKEIDVMILCGGSAKDLPQQGPELAALFNTVDSYDNHARIPEYFQKMDQVSKKAGKLSLISTGWDPGLFSMLRVLEESILPEGKGYSFWGKGVSQGHSDAVRRVSGVKNGVQYTVPLEDAVNRVRKGENPELKNNEKHLRIVYVVAEENANLQEIEEEIVNLPHYFRDYKTQVHFISEEELNQDHSGMPHGGFVIRTGTTLGGFQHKIEFNLNLENNPEFTASVLVAYTRAVNKLALEGEKGARTVFDIPISYLSPKTGEELRKDLL